MQQKVLNNKIGIQITLLLIGIGILLIGIFYPILEYTNIDFSFNGSIYSYSIYGSGYGYASNSGAILIGIALIFVGVAAVIISSINMANYVQIKKSLSNVQANTNSAMNVAQPTYTPSKNNNSLENIANKIAYLQQMQADGYISDEEYEEMKSNVLKNAGGTL